MRLIDADALKREINESGQDGTFANYVRGVLAATLDHAPTVDAEPVRHGRWIHVHGYITPGGDPVWRCSECGKGEHVYGVEHGTYGADISDGQWVACPNCGAVIDREEY